MIENTTTTEKTQYETDPEEAKWVALAKQGDQTAFTNIVESYQRPIYNLCYRMLGSTGEAEDAAQESFIRAFMKLDSYDADRKFSSWLFSIASHYCIDRLRKRRIQSVSWEELPPWQVLPHAEPKELFLKHPAESYASIRVRGGFFLRSCRYRIFPC